MKTVKNIAAKEIIKFNPLDALQKVGKEVVLFVPQEVDGEKVLNSYMDDLTDNLATLFGGYEIADATAGLVNPDTGKLTEEPVYVISVVFDTEDENKMQKFISIADKIKLDLFQKQVYIKVVDTVYSV